MAIDVKTPRPLSPHLLIYKRQMTSVLSILHRIAGIGLAFGLVILVWWLASLASGPEVYAHFAACAKSTFGQMILFGLSVAFFYHLSNGIRHLLWDTGSFLDIKDAYMTGRIVILVTIILTLVVWLKAYGVFL